MKIYKVYGEMLVRIPCYAVVKAEKEETAKKLGNLLPESEWFAGLDIEHKIVEINSERVEPIIED